VCRCLCVAFFQLFGVSIVDSNSALSFLIKMASKPWKTLVTFDDNDSGKDSTRPLAHVFDDQHPDGFVFVGRIKFQFLDCAKYRFLLSGNFERGREDHQKAHVCLPPDGNWGWEMREEDMSATFKMVFSFNDAGLRRIVVHIPYYGGGKGNKNYVGHLRNLLTQAQDAHAIAKESSLDRARNSVENREEFEQSFEETMKSVGARTYTKYSVDFKWSDIPFRAIEYLSSDDDDSDDDDSDDDDSDDNDSSPSGCKDKRPAKRKRDDDSTYKDDDIDGSETNNQGNVRKTRSSKRSPANQNSTTRTRSSDKPDEIQPADDDDDVSALSGPGGKIVVVFDPNVLPIDY